MATLYATTRRFRDRLLVGDRAAQVELVEAYARVLARLEREAARLEARIARAAARGEDLTPAVLYQERRIERLRAEAEREMARFAEKATPIIRSRVEAAATLGVSHSRELVDLATPATWVPRLPTAAVELAVAATERGAPLEVLLRQAAGEGSAAVVDALVSGVATGQSPRVVAAEIRRASGIPLQRSLRIARTESLRAYRESSRLGYQANRQVVRAWVWVCALDRRSCASCIAQHGSEHPLDEVMATHPNCRCTMAPKSISWAELGVDAIDPPFLPETGPEWFGRQSAEVQELVLGKGAARAFRGRQVALEDFVARRVHPTWGPSTRQAGLTEARRNARLRREAA